MSKFWSARESGALLRFIDERCGLQIRSDQLVSTTQVVERLMRQLGCLDVAQLEAALNRDPHSMDSLIDELTIGETYFFREPKHFRFISEVVLPEARLQLKGSRPIQLWSAACASGEEAYSLAMVAAQLGYQQCTRILGTDISQAAISKARKGRYREWSFRGNAQARAAGTIMREGDAWVVDPELRDRVTFRQLNLVSDDLAAMVGGRASYDLILCRNVFIYFSHQTVATVTARLVECLAEGGWLITASADPPLTECPGLEVVSTDLGVFYRRADTVRIPESAASRRLGVQVDSAANGDLPGWDDEPQVQSRTRTPPDLTGPLPEPTAGRAEGAMSAVLAEAQVALASGDLAHAIALTEPLIDHLEACVLNLQAQTQRDAQAALLRMPETVRRHPLSPELHYLYAVLLLDNGRIDEAHKAVQKAVFLDRSLAVPHFLLGSIQQQRGQLEAAWRHYRNARDLCRQLPPETVMPLTEGASAAELAAAAGEHMKRIGTQLE